MGSYLDARERTTKDVESWDCGDDDAVPRRTAILRTAAEIQRTVDLRSQSLEQLPVLVLRKLRPIALVEALMKLAEGCFIVQHIETILTQVKPKTWDWDRRTLRKTARAKRRN